MMWLATLLLLSSSTTVTRAQFSCTLTNKDETTCLDAKDDGGSGYCVWCNLSGFGFCVAEDQAESMEENLPGIQCDRHSGADDDATPATDDDATPTTDDEAPTPSDDSIPDDFWTCLQKKTSDKCVAADCTWCTSNQYGFGVCMTGPTAESAAESDFFTCTNSSTTTSSVDGEEKEELEQAVTSALRGTASGLSASKATLLAQPFVADPSDLSCLQAFLQDPTEDGCEAAVDADGAPCEFCSYQQVQICLNEEQAQIGEQLIGLECGSSDDEQEVLDPMDPSCLQAFLQNPTEAGCEAAVDSDGAKCEFCTLNSQEFCLNQEQAQIGQQFIPSLECASEEPVVQQEPEEKDPRDPTCALAFLANPTQDACVETKDTEGSPCEYCTLPGSSMELCLTQDQAEAAGAMGIECSEKPSMVEANPLDTSCLMAFINAQGSMTPEDCTSATDNEGAPCEFCFVTDVPQAPLCLTSLQADLASQVGGDEWLSCGATAETVTASLDDPYDPTCALAYLQNPTRSACTDTNDVNGNGCEFCTLQQGGASLNLCLNEEQAQVAESIGIDCGDENAGNDDDAAVNDDAVQDGEEETTYPLDPLCLAAGMGSDDAEDVCNSTKDSEGSPCVWCNAAGVYGLCLSSDAATKASEYLQCDMNTVAMS